MRDRQDGREAEGYRGRKRSGGVAAEEEGKGSGKLCTEYMTLLEWLSRVEGDKEDGRASA